MRILTLFLLTVALSVPATPAADAQTGPFAAIRAYPAGLVGAAGVAGAPPGVRGSERLETGVWAGYNLTRRRDWGEHDDERGGGFGGGVEAAYFPESPGGGWFAGIRAAVWRLEIEWRDESATPTNPVRTGETRIVVLQPTARAGYRFGLGGRSESRARLDAEAALGAEFNARTDGEDVGQGVILLVGLRLGL